MVFCSLCHFHAHTHIQLLQRGKAGHNIKGHPPPPMVQRGRVTDGKGRNGIQIKEQYGPIDAGPKGEGEKREMDKRGQTGSIWQIWQVKLAVINPQDWAYLYSLVCFPVVRVVLYG